MPSVERYISTVGAETGNAMKLVLFQLLLKRYRATKPADFPVGLANDSELPEKLATAVVDWLFRERTANPELRSFITKNSGLIESKAKELSSEDALCRALSCAMYISCYGRYVDSGRKIGMLFHPFLGFFRAFQQVTSGRESLRFLDSFEPSVGHENVEPLLNLWALGLYRQLPYTPDSKLMMDEVLSFGRSVGASVST